MKLAESSSFDIAEIEYSPTIRLFDPNGRVFFYGGGVYRGIYPHRVEFVKRLFAEGIVSELMNKKLLIGTYLTDKRLQGFGLVLQHDAIEVISRSKEWSFVTYIEAAKAYLNLYLELHKKGLTLMDGHSGNFSLAPGGRVIWHDFGSIIKAETSSVHGLQEYLAHFYYPLMLYKLNGDFSIVRRLGLPFEKEDYYRLVFPRVVRLADFAAQYSSQAWAKAVMKAYRIVSHRYLLPFRTRNFIQIIHSKLQRKINGHGNIERLIDHLYTAICNIPYRFKKTKWSVYYKQCDLKEWKNSRDRRQEKILQLLERINPNRLLDLGANQGMFSHLASRVSPCVIASDSDEIVVAKHAYELLLANNSCHVYPVLLDVTKIDEDIISRYRSHTVLALALTHHLRLTQGYPFEFIGKRFSNLAEKVLITEFMPKGVDSFHNEAGLLPADYNLICFLDSLKHYFSSVQVLDYMLEEHNSPRTLVFCEK